MARGAHPSDCLTRGLRMRKATAISASCAKVGAKNSATTGARRKTPMPSTALMSVQPENHVKPTQSVFRSPGRGTEIKVCIGVGRLLNSLGLFLKEHGF